MADKEKPAKAAAGESQKPAADKGVQRKPRAALKARRPQGRQVG